MRVWRVNFLSYPIVPLLVSWYVMTQSGCLDKSNDTLANYEASRPLILLRVTQSFTPQIQWVGGRVAAVGANFGSVPALDSTLVWLTTAEENSIDSFVTVGSGTDVSRIQQVGGTPIDSLQDGAEYTFWLAEKEALDSNLSSNLLNQFNFTDTTQTMSFLLRGQQGGDPSLNLSISIVRDETLLEEKILIDWSPPVAFRRFAVRAGTFGAFTDLIWHIVTPDSVADNIVPPLILGEAPSGTDEAIALPESGLQPGQVHFFWMVNNDWPLNDFRPTATGYAWFRMFAL